VAECLVFDNLDQFNILEDGALGKNRVCDFDLVVGECGNQLVWRIGLDRHAFG
jgi:hypothetical protein